MDMLEAAKFYKDCIMDARKCIIAEIHPADNSLVVFDIKIFDCSETDNRCLYIKFSLNEEEFNESIYFDKKTTSSELSNIIINNISYAIAKKITLQGLEKI